MREGVELIRSWLRPDTLILGGVILVVAYLAMTPLAMLIYGSLQSGFMVGKGEFTLANYIEAYSDREFYTLFLNSLIYALGVSLFTFLIGTIMAWTCERTNTPGRKTFAIMAVAAYIIPGVLLTISWILLLSPRIGLLNNLLITLFGLAEPPLTIYSYWGMIWTASVHLYPLNFLIMSAAFRSMDSSLEEAAWAAGANNFTCLRQITLKILRPALLSTMLILFIRGIESFEVPALIGIPARIFVFTTRIYEAASGFPPALGLAGANASILLFISVIGVFLYQKMTAQKESFTTITGKGFRPRIIDLGRWKYLCSAGCIFFFVLTLFLPVLALLGTSFSRHMVALTPEAFKNFSLEEYRFVLSYPIITRAFRNSVILAAGSATVVMFLTSIIAWITVRTKIPGRWMLDALTFIPIAIPGVISGASWAQTFFRIVLPLLLPGFLSGWIYVAIISLRELSASIFLVGQGTEVLSTIVFSLWDGGSISSVAALGVLMTLFLIVIALIVQRWQRRLGILHE